jgi:hypothetical protein
MAFWVLQSAIKNIPSRVLFHNYAVKFVEERIYLPLLCKDLFQEKLLKIHATCKAEFRSWKFYKSLFSHKIYFILQITTKAEEGPRTHKKAFDFSDSPTPTTA